MKKQIIVRTPHNILISRIQEQSLFELFWFAQESLHTEVCRSSVAFTGTAVLEYHSEAMLRNLIDMRGFFTIYVEFMHPELGLVQELAEFSSIKKTFLGNQRYMTNVKGVDIAMPDELAANIGKIKGITHPRTAFFNGNYVQVKFTSEVLFDEPIHLKAHKWNGVFILPHIHTQLWKSLNKESA